MQGDTPPSEHAGIIAERNGFAGSLRGNVQVNRVFLLEGAFMTNNKFF
jgi:hypothetical protein